MMASVWIWNGRGTCAARRERCRKVHPDEHFIWFVWADKRQNSGARKADENRRPQRCKPPWHWHGAPAFQIGECLYNALENCAWRWTGRARHFKNGSGSRAYRAVNQAIQSCRWSGRKGGIYHSWNAAACGNSENALSGQWYPDFWRTDGCSDPTGNWRAYENHPRADERGKIGSVHFA